MKNFFIRICAVVICAFVCLSLLYGCTEGTAELEKKFSLNVSEITLNVGEVLALKVVSETSVDYSYVAWSSFDEDVAQVDSGVVNAVGAGKTRIEATVTVYKNNGSVTASYFCDVTVTEQYTPLTEIIFENPAMSLQVGSSVLLTPLCTPINATGLDFVWTSSAPEVASVNEYGLICALSEGSATITVTDSKTSLFASCEIAVTFDAVGSVPVLAPNTVSLTIGSTANLKLVYPEGTDSLPVTWSSSDTTIATVDENGVVTAVKAGEVTIYADCGGYKISCAVIVTAKQGEDIRVNLNITDITVYEGDKSTYRLRVTNGNFSGSWSSSKPSIVTVDDDGEMKFGDTFGAAEIRYKIDGITYARCKVYYYEKLLTLDVAEKSVSIPTGESYQIKTTLNSGGITRANITYESSSKNTATVSKSGLIEAQNEGTATIRVTATQGDISYSQDITLTVTRGESKISITEESVSLKVGDKHTLTAKVSPSTLHVIWYTSDSCVTVVNGVITAVSEGSATITAEADGKHATCTVTVTAKAEEPDPDPDPAE